MLTFRLKHDVSKRMDYEFATAGITECQGIEILKSHLGSINKT